MWEIRGADPPDRTTRYPRPRLVCLPVRERMRRRLRQSLPALWWVSSPASSHPGRSRFHKRISFRPLRFPRTRRSSTASLSQVPGLWGEREPEGPTPTRELLPAPRKVCRISVSPPPATSRKCLVSWIASCFDAAWMMAKPPTSSLVSANGPSVTTNFPSERRTRAPAEDGRHPSVASSHPARNDSSINFPIASISFCVGGTSGLPGLYIHKYRIAILLSLILIRTGAPTGPPDRIQQ